MKATLDNLKAEFQRRNIQFDELISYSSEVTFCVNKGKVISQSQNTNRRFEIRDIQGSGYAKHGADPLFMDWLKGFSLMGMLAPEPKGNECCIAFTEKPGISDDDFDALKRMRHSLH
jgi:hypothetical protein